MNLSKVDWFGFRSKGEIPEVIEGLRGVFASQMPPLTAHPRKGGWNGFKSSANLCLGDMVVGLMAYGGGKSAGECGRKYLGYWLRMAETGLG